MIAASFVLRALMISRIFSLNVLKQLLSGPCFLNISIGLDFDHQKWHLRIFSLPGNLECWARIRLSKPHPYGLMNWKIIWFRLRGMWQVQWIAGLWLGLQKHIDASWSSSVAVNLRSWICRNHHGKLGEKPESGQVRRCRQRRWHCEQLLGMQSWYGESRMSNLVRVLAFFYAFPS